MLFFDLVLLAFLALLVIHPNFLSTLGNNNSHNNSKQHQHRMIQFIAMILLALRIIVFVTVTAVAALLNNNDMVSLLKSYTTKSSSSATSTAIKKPLVNAVGNSNNGNNDSVSPTMQKQKQSQEVKQKQKRYSVQGPASHSAASSSSSSLIKERSDLIIDTQQSVLTKDTMKNIALEDKMVETKVVERKNNQRPSTSNQEKQKQSLPIEEGNKIVEIIEPVVAQTEKLPISENQDQFAAIAETPKKEQEQETKTMSTATTATEEAIDATTISLAIGKEEELSMPSDDDNNKDKSNNNEEVASSEEVSTNKKSESTSLIHLQQKSNTSIEPEELPNQQCASVHSKNSSQIDSSEEHSSDDTALTSDASETSLQPTHTNNTTTTTTQQPEVRQQQKQETEKPVEKKQIPVEQVQSQLLKKQSSVQTLEDNSPVTAASSVHSVSTASQNTSLLARMAGKAKSNSSKDSNNIELRPSESTTSRKSGILPIRTSSLRLGRRSNSSIRQEAKTTENGSGAPAMHKTLSMKLPKGAGNIFSNNKSHETNNNNTPTKTTSTPRQFFASLGRRSKVPESSRKEHHQVQPQMQPVQADGSNSSSSLKKARLVKSHKRISTLFQ